MRLDSSVVLLVCLRISSGFVCDVKETCDTCITFEEDHCVWCPAKIHNSSRCLSQSYANNLKTWCLDEVINPQSRIEIIEEANLNGKTGYLRPKRIKIKARPNVPVNFTMAYKPEFNQPLDVYILIDNSGSMEQLKAELSQIVNDLYRKLSNDLNHVHIGLGSFSEKPAKPYVVSRPDIYSFKNHLKLGINVSAFSEAIELMKAAPNSDDLEAGLDALMQVMVCDKEIGWRNKARRMIVYCSDQGYHIAGDGKMIGIIKPNDMKCHLQNNIHDTALEYDYPSVGQLNKIAVDRDISTIFVVKSNNDLIKSSYELLSKLIRGARFVSMIDDEKIAEIVLTEYNKMRETVTITYDYIPGVTLALSPDCLQHNNEECEIDKKENIIINVTLILNKCEGNNFMETFLIGPMELTLNERLQIDLEGLCKCDCEQLRDHNALECNNYGKYQCGVCECFKGRFGEHCECDDSNAFLKKCTHDLCNLRGSCECGKCRCFKGYIGEYCEVIDYSCKFYNGTICAGNGFCVNSKCQCYDGWTREDCSCATSTTSCVSNQSSEICSNHGKCICNQCECRDGYSGPLCDYCTECARKTCKDLKEYAICLLANKRTICDTKFNDLFNVIESKIVTREEMNMNKNLHLKCGHYFENGSEIIFSYQQRSNKWMLMIQNVLDSPPEASIWVPISVTVGSVMLGGLIILLIWKYTLQYFDKKEYLEFMAEVKLAQLNVTMQNPIYVNPVTTFQNPTYRDDL